jgi:hypothetical protein
VTYAIGILEDCAPEERCVAILPSPRVRAPDFCLILRRNGVIVRALGYGSSWVSDPTGRKGRIYGVVLAAVRSGDLHKLSMHARLCGVIAVPLRSDVARR